jgi:hypothetical protein
MRDEQVEIKQARRYLPELFVFAESLSRRVEDGTLVDWPEFTSQAKDFYTLERMDEMERVLPGWKRMAEFADGVTLVHVTSALVALLQLPEYKIAPDNQKRIMEWTVLFHDSAKEIIEGQRDNLHAFRSAVLAARGLSALGFVQSDSEEFKAWCEVTWSGVKFDESTGEDVQDNQCLPSILAGLKSLFGVNTPAVLIIKSILLHWSIVTVTDWPPKTPLVDEELARYIEADLHPVLQALLLVDSDAWSLFDPKIKKDYRQQTLAAFEKIGQLIGM